MLKESDKRVVKAFVDERPADSNLLETDGVRLDKIGLGGETVAKWVNGRIAIVSTESAKSDESIIRLISKTAGPGVVDFSYARKGHRVHEHGAMGRNGRGIYHGTPAGKHDIVIYQGRSPGDGSQPNWRIDLVTSASGTHTDITGPNRGYSAPSAAFTAALDAQLTRGIVGKSHVYIADRDGNLSDYELEEEPFERNGRATVADETAARELSLYIENEYALIGAPNSIGKNIDAGLRRKVASGKYNPALTPKAWQYLIEEGAKRYQREFGSGSPIFNAATRRQVAEEYARAWESENGYRSNGRVHPDMEEYADWDYEDFYQDLLEDGRTKRDAHVHALASTRAVGKLDYLPPRNIPKGWILHQTPILRRRDGKPAFVGHKGTKYMVFWLDGTPASPELSRIRGLLEWKGENWLDAR